MRKLTAAMTSVVVFAVASATLFGSSFGDRVLNKVFPPGCSAGMSQVAVRSSADGSDQPACFRAASVDDRPMIVNLHQWSADYREVNAGLLDFAVKNDLNIIVPNARGPGNTPASCGSDLVISDVDDAIAYARRKSPEGKVVVVGISGGGFTALNHLYRSKHRASYYSVWVPITDLGAWYWQSDNRGLKYAGDIKDCTSLDPVQLAVRSPLTYANTEPVPEDTRLLLAAGASDGHGALAVPISHTLDFFDVIADKVGAPKVPVEMRTTLLTMAFHANDLPPQQRSLFEASAGPVDLLIFKGGHEMMVDYSLGRIASILELGVQTDVPIATTE